MNCDCVIACIGCTEVVGDSLGPLVGDLLIQKNLNTFVYGTTDNPITSKNLDLFISTIKKNHPFSKIIAVDACLGRVSEVGKVKMIRGGIAPGKALNSEAKKIGDLGVLGVVGEIHDDPLTELLTRSHDFILNMAQKTYDVILKFFNDNQKVAV